MPPEKIKEVELDLADVLIYLVRLADKLDIDSTDAPLRKISISEKKYPKDIVLGSSKNYTEQ